MVDHYRPEVDEVEARLDIINPEMAYRFRDVYDQFARMADDGIMFHDRVTGILDAHLASVSNRLADVSKVLAVIATLFGPMTVITGLMVLTSTGLFVWFRKSGWW